MAVTTQDAVYRSILTTLEAGSTGVPNEQIYLAPFPIAFQTDAACLQLIPGVLEAREPLSGTGLVDEQFRVAHWARLFLDEPGRSEIRVADASLGMLETMRLVRAALIQSRFTGGTASIPCQFIRASQIIESLEHPGWSYIEDTYRTSYEIAWTS